MSLLIVASQNVYYLNFNVPAAGIALTSKIDARGVSLPHMEYTPNLPHPKSKTDPNCDPIPDP